MMRKVVLSLIGGSALLLASAANATISIVGCDSNLNSCSFSNSLSPLQSTLAWEDSNVSSPTFSSFIDFSNDVGGNYWLSLTTSTPDLLFTSLSVTPITGSGSITYAGLPTSSITLLPGSLGIGSYHLSFGGNSPSGGAESGNLTFRPAVPEPATWAMMLLGFGAM